MQDTLIGLWSLQSWDKVYADGREVPLVEGGVSGFLHYARNGLMAVSIYEREGHRLLTTYAGPYEARDHEVLHLPVAGHSPEGLSAPKRRYVHRRGSTLLLSTDWIDTLSLYKYKLTWQKLN